MKKIVFFALFFLIFASFMSLNGQWAKIYGGTEGDEAEFIQQTADGGYIVAAETFSFGAEVEDVWILKLTSSGDIEWQRTYGGSEGDWALHIRGTSDGGYIATGNTESFGAGESDLWVLKLDSTGDIEWQRTYGGYGYEFTYSIKQTNDGGYIVAGRTESFGAGESDGWVLKLTSFGDIEWQRTYGGGRTDCSLFIRETSDGGYIATSCTYSFGAGENDIWVLKLSSFGDIEWQHTYGGSDREYGSSIQQTSDGGYIVAGYTISYGSGCYDLLILKLGPNGDIPSCAIIGSSDAIVSDTSISPLDTSVIPINTDVIPQSTNILPQESDATVYNLCPGPHTLTLSATAGGTTDLEPGTYTYVGAEEVIIRAIANSGNRFTGWSGDASGMDNPLLVTMDSDKSITANFTAISTGNGGGSGTGKKNGCFIATAAYGSPLHPYVNILRFFRDKYLMPSRVGQALVDLYYKYSLSVADFITKHKALKIAVRISLLPIIAFSCSLVHLGPIVTAVILVFILAFPIFIVCFHRREKRRVEVKDIKSRPPVTK